MDRRLGMWAVFSKNPILLDQIVDDMLLMLVLSSSQSRSQRTKWVESRAHPQIVSPEAPDFLV
jgi:hypothetical protein